MNSSAPSAAPARNSLLFHAVLYPITGSRKFREIFHEQYTLGRLERLGHPIRDFGVMMALMPKDILERTRSPKLTTKIPALVNVYAAGAVQLAVHLAASPFLGVAAGIIFVLNSKEDARKFVEANVTPLASAVFVVLCATQLAAWFGFTAVIRSVARR